MKGEVTMYEYTYETAERAFIIWKLEGMKAEALLKVDTQAKAERACHLYEKFGHGALRYPVKG